MKGGQNLRDLQQKKDDAEGWVKPQPCMVCAKVVVGAYGMWANGWTCSLKCEEKYNAPVLEAETSVLES